MTAWQSDLTIPSNTLACARTADRDDKIAACSRGVMTPSSPQEVAVLIPLVLALLTTLITIGVHAVAIGTTVQFIGREYQLRHAGVGFWTDVAIMAGVTLLALIAHLVEITIWAVLYDACGEFTGLAPAFYHSAVNYTSPASGDAVISASWDL